MSKSQVTLFIILGIVILLTFFFIFFIIETTYEKKLEAEIEKPVADFLKSKTINYYVISCLDRVSKEALTLIGEQGGFIYQGQSGLVDWPIPSVNYQDKMVTFQIYSSLSNNFKEKDPLINNPPYYPCFKRSPPNTDELEGIACYKNYNHINPKQKLIYFGSTGDPEKNINPDLCKDKITIPNYVCSCYNPPYSLNCRYSIQSQLEDYTKKKVKECLDFSVIKGYNITAGDINAEVGFSDNNVLFKIDIPITIRVKGSEPIIEVFQFSLPQPVRFKIIYYLAREMIQKDIDAVDFDILKDGQELANTYEGIKIKRDSSAYKDATIISIEDSKSKLGEKNYVFMFARENRGPALDYMKFISFSNYDLYVIENQSLNFTPTAYDPDEHDETSPLFYDYSSFDWNKENNTLANALELSSIYANPKKDECTHPFSESSEEKRCAYYQLHETDVGEHTLTVKAQDLGGLYDSQEIRILVDDIPKINLILNNTFADIDNNRASIEDPFIFDASKTKDEFPKPVTLLFSWDIKPSNSPGFNLNWGYINKISLPNPNPDIDDMTGFFDEVGVHNIKLEVKNQHATPIDNIVINKSQIIVTECLPHRSKDAPYPFYNIDWDGYGYSGEITEDLDYFQGNHTCCRDDYTYADKNQICYNLVDYGCLDDFTNTYSQYYDPGKLSIEGFTPLIDTSGSSGNKNKDVYERTLIRKCSGVRGNTCNGDVATYTINFYRACIGTRQCTHSNYPGGACKE